MIETDFGYAQARLQARHAERLSESAWAALGGQGDAQAFVERARQTPLRRWLHGISGGASVHEIERRLRREFVAAIERVARWVPRRWRAAVECCAALVYLPLASRLRSEEAREAWMDDEAAFALSAIAWRPPLASGETRDGTALDAWLGVWRASWPRGAPDARARLEGAIGRLRAELRLLAPLAAREALAGREVWSRRRALAAEFARRFRADSLTAAAVFDALLLDALELERLRAELVRRTLYAAEAA
jgi:hypothetical protein